MAVLKKSLSEDSVDHYSHTWAFLLLFLLSVITLFVTLSPSLAVTKPTITQGHSVLDNIEDNDQLKANVDSEVPHYTASCWTPAQFTASYVIYTNALCSAALNSLIKGRNFSEARLYHTPSDEIPIGPFSEARPLGVEDFPQISKSIEDSDKKKKKQPSDENEEMENFQTKLEFLQYKREKAHSGIQELVIYKTPLYLFLLAICLRLPHAISSLLSNFCGCINVNQTLASAQTSLTIDAHCRQKLMEDLSMSLGKSNRKATSLIYLMMKLLMVIVLCVEVIVVCHCLLVESDKLENDLDAIRVMNDISVRDYGNKETDNEVQETTQNTNYTDYIYMCEYGIRQFAEIKRFSVQCLFRMDGRKSLDENVIGNNKDDNELNGSQHSRNTESDVNDELLFMYKGLYTIVLAMLIVLVFLNISSLAAWLLKLLLSSRRLSMGLKADTAMDVVFLVSMAWNNTSAFVATDLAKYSSWSETDGHEDDSYKVKQDIGDN